MKKTIFFIISIAAISLLLSCEKDEELTPKNDIILDYVVSDGLNGLDTIFYKYNSKGLVYEAYFTAVGNSNRISYYEYDEQNRLIKKTHPGMVEVIYKYIENKVIKYSFDEVSHAKKIVYTFNSSGNCIQTDYYYGDKYENTFLYLGEDFNWDVVNWDFSFTTYYKWLNGNIIEKRTEGKKHETVTTYKYDNMRNPYSSVSSITDPLFKTKNNIVKVRSEKFTITYTYLYRGYGYPWQKDNGKESFHYKEK